jgi:hypothetical protein
LSFSRFARAPNCVATIQDAAPGFILIPAITASSMTIVISSPGLIARNSAFYVFCTGESLPVSALHSPPARLPRSLHPFSVVP